VASSPRPRRCWPLLDEVAAALEPVERALVDETSALVAAGLDEAALAAARRAGDRRGRMEIERM
jgi:hypothetical protein